MSGGILHCVRRIDSEVIRYAVEVPPHGLVDAMRLESFKPGTLVRHTYQETADA
jgi:hypothetical protein